MDEDAGGYADVERVCSQLLAGQAHLHLDEARASAADVGAQPRPLVACVEWEGQEAEAEASTGNDKALKAQTGGGRVSRPKQNSRDA